MIAAGKVVVNGQIVTELGTRVSPTDQIQVNGKQISTQAFVYILLNKPRDTISTVSDDRGRKTVIDLVTRPELTRGLFPVGRLDRNTTGALLLTTDGDLANRLMHPKWEIEKIYLIETSRPLGDDDLQKLRDGVKLDDGIASADEVTFPDPADKSRLAMQIHEGRNRQVRRMLEAIGHEVTKLERIRFAGLTLANLRRGRWRRITDSEIRKLRKLVRL